MAEVVFEHVDKIYPNGVQAIADLNLQLSDGELLVLVGPSGCGKSTALRMAAGLEEITGGTVRIGDRVVNDVHAKDRDVAMVFQNYALYPHMTVYDNVAFALKLRKMPKAEIDSRVREAARILELGDLLARKPAQLSGGQRQRVAMGRAIVRQPKAFLMDEPLSNLDAKLRVQMRAEIARIQHELGVTTLYVTHDQVEAMTMGDRVAVMRKGVLQQAAGPKELYDRPANLFVGGFIGSPAMNLIDVGLELDSGSGATITLGRQRLALGAEVVAERPRLRSYAGRRVVVGLRPEDMQDAALVPDHPADRRLQVHLDLVELLGPEVIVHFALEARPVVTDDTKELAADAGPEVAHDLEARAAANTFDCVARFDPRSAARPGDHIQVAVDTTRVHFFDLESGEAIWD